MDKKKENGRNEILRDLAYILEQANKARPLDEVSLEEVEEVEASNSKQTVTEVEKSKCRPSLDSLRKRPDMGYMRSRSRSPLKYRRSKQGNDSESPFYKENIKSDWSWSRIKEEQRKPGVCRRLPETCKPWVGKDGRFKTCGYLHPWLSQWTEEISWTWPQYYFFTMCNIILRAWPSLWLFSSARNSYSHPDLVVTQHQLFQIIWIALN